jgi:hypothetical protein
MQNFHTAITLTFTPRSANSALSARNVMSGAAAKRAKTQSRSPIRTNGRRPPIRAGAGEPVLRARCDHFTTADTLMENRSAASRQLAPASTAATTRRLRSSE